MYAGDKVPTGLWYATVLPDIDFETYSEAGYVWRDGTQKWISAGSKSSPGIAAVGAPAYAEHPSTEILSCAYNLKDGQGPRLWVPGCPPPQDLFDHLSQGDVLEAWNCLFEFLIWNYVGHLKMDWPQLDYRQLRDAMAKARASGLPGKLSKASEVVGVRLKDVAKGQRVIRRYCIPRNPTKKDSRLRIRPEEEQDGVQLYEYNLGDIEAEQSVSLTVPDLSEQEHAVWQLDQAINIRGVYVDRQSVSNCIAILEQAYEIYEQELNYITNGELTSLSKVEEMRRWLVRYGVPMESMDEEAVDAALERVDPSTVSYRVLQIRGRMASANVRKLYAFDRMTSRDGRLRGLFLYHLAHTGRFASGGVQLHNMASSGPDVRYCESCHGFYTGGPGREACPHCGCLEGLSEPKSWGIDAAAHTLEQVFSHGRLGVAEWILGDQVIPAMAGCIRSLITAAPGKELICSDYSAIEAVVLAVLAGEQWQIEVFQTHGLIYEATAAGITGVTLEEMIEHKKRTGEHHPHRKPYGKIPSLASGFGGWIGAWKSFGADKFMDEGEMKTNILKWREESPSIVELWGGQWRETYPGSWDFYYELHGLEGMAISAVMCPGRPFTHRFISYYHHEASDALYCRLPSGRCLTYHQPRLRETVSRRHGKLEYQLTYMGWNTNPKKGPRGWIRISTYGGSLAENCIAEGTLVLTDRGWVPVEEVALQDQIHDGVEFVRHEGLIDKGTQRCTQVDGVGMTPDHEVLTDENWKTASQDPRPYRPTIRNVGGVGTGGERREEAKLGVFLRLWKYLQESWNRSDKDGKSWRDPQLWLSYQNSPKQEENARNDPTPDVRGVAIDGGPLPLAIASCLAQLRGPRHSGVRTVAEFVRSILARHGSHLRSGAYTGPKRQQQQLRAKQLSVGGPSNTSQQQAQQRENPHSLGRHDSFRSVKKIRDRSNYAAVPDRPQVGGERFVHPAGLYESKVYDLLNAGPRNRFVVLGEGGPFIVHNCTQAVARDIFVHGMLNVSRAGYPIVLHTHDELAAEVPEGWGSVEEFEALMVDLPDWCRDWPIRAEGGWRGKRYRK